MELWDGLADGYMEGWGGLADGYSLHICTVVPHSTHSMVTTNTLATLSISSPTVALALSLVGQS